MKSSTCTLIAGLIAGAGLILPCAAGAFNIDGRVVNGTTGEPHTPATILVVKPSGGMMVEQEVETDDELGRFTIQDLDASAPVYLLRVQHEGVSYTEFVQPGEGDTNVELRVYDTTESLDGVHFSIPHLVLSTRPDSLLVEKFYTIVNHSEPPRAIPGSRMPFRFHLPMGTDPVQSVYVMSLGIPLPAAPQSTDKENVFALDHAILPGETQVAMSLAFPYGSETFAYREVLQHTMSDVVVVVADPALEVTSRGAPLEHAAEGHGFTSYHLGMLAEGEMIALELSGGSGGAAVPTSSSASPQIFIAPNSSNLPSLVLLGLMALVLGALAIVALTRATNRERQEGVLLARREALLAELARLDDLHKTGTVPDKVYTLKRSELVNSLAQIYYRTRADSEADNRQDSEGAARV